MTPERRLAMQAAVAAGGAAAALMHYAVVCDDDELAVAADECLEPILCAALRVIDAVGLLEVDGDRRNLRDAIEAYRIATGDVTIEHGRCRSCGCTEDAACVQSDNGEWDGPCGWADSSQTLCDNPDCLAKAGVAAAPELVS
jgi:hypothetical protein